VRHATRLLSEALDTGQVDAAAIVDPERHVLHSRFDAMLDDVVEIAGTARPIFRDVSPPVRLLDLDFDNGRLLILPTGLSTLVLRTESSVDAGRLLDGLGPALDTFAEADRSSVPPGGEAGDLAAWLAANPSETAAAPTPGGPAAPPAPPIPGAAPPPAPEARPDPGELRSEDSGVMPRPAVDAPAPGQAVPGLAAAPAPVYDPEAARARAGETTSARASRSGDVATQSSRSIERLPASEPRAAMVEVMNRLSRVATSVLGGPVVRNYLKKSQSTLTDDHPSLAPFAIDLKGMVTCSDLDDVDARELGPAVRAWASAFIDRASQVVPELASTDLGELTSDLDPLLRPNGFLP